MLTLFNLLGLQVSSHLGLDNVGAHCGNINFFSDFPQILNWQELGTVSKSKSYVEFQYECMPERLFNMYNGVKHKPSSKRKLHWLQFSRTGGEVVFNLLMILPARPMLYHKVVKNTISYFYLRWHILRLHCIVQMLQI